MLAALAIAWSLGPSLPLERTEVQVAALGSRLFVVGGFPQAADARVDVFDVATGKWSAAAPLPAGGNHLAVAGGDGRVWVFGGLRKDKASDDAFEYDAASDRWSRLPALPLPCVAGAAVYFERKVHIVGGWCGGEHDADAHWVFDPQARTYSKKAAIPHAREHFLLIPANGRLFAIGGRFDTKTVELDDVEIYDPARDAWTRGAPLPEKRSGYAAALLGGEIFVLGGDNGSEKRQLPSHDDVFAYDVAANSWSRRGRLPYGVHGTGAAAFDGRLYVPAGSKLGGHELPLRTMIVSGP